MPRAAILLVGLGCLVFPAIGHAQLFIRAKQIVPNCESRGAQDQTACNTYIAGALDQIANSPDLKTTVCVPANTTLEELRHALAKYGRQHPEDNERSGAFLLNALLKANYPCPDH